MRRNAQRGVTLLIWAAASAWSACGGGGGEVQPYQVEVERVGDLPAGVHGLAFGADGALWLSDSYRNAGPLGRVYRLEPPFDGAPEPTDLFADIPAGLLVEAGMTFLCATGEDAVRSFDHQLDPSTEWSVPAPWNLIRRLDSLLSVTYGGSLHRLEPDGSAVLLFEGLEFPFDLAPGPDGTVWISEQVDAGVAGRVRRWSLGGEPVESLACELENPEGLALDDRGALYVADTDAGRVIRSLPDGTCQTVAQDLFAPITFAAGPDGDLFFNTSGAQAGLWRLRLVDP